MKLKYYVQKLLGIFLDEPIIFEGKTCGYSLVKSESAASYIAEGAKVYSPYFLHSVHIDKYTTIAQKCHIANCQIGKFVSIGPNFCCGFGIHPTHALTTCAMFYSPSKINGYSFTEKAKIIENKPSKIGNDVFIGANVTVMDGVTIGDGAVIGAGAVVSKDIPPYAIAVGCPIRVAKYRMTEDQIAAMQRIQWWNWDDDRLQDVERMFEDIDGFIEKYDCLG